MDEQQQYAVAVSAFDAYYGLLNGAYGRPYPHRKYQEHALWRKFLKVADTCIRHGWPVEQYIRTVVEYSGKESDAITPNDLVGPAKEQLFLARRATTDAVPPAREWQLRERDLLRMQAATGLSDVDALASPLNTVFPAWFRVFYPETLHDEILDAYWADAADEMRGNREIVKFLRATCPSRLAEAERRMGVVDGL